MARRRPLEPEIQGANLATPSSRASLSLSLTPNKQRREVSHHDHRLIEDLSSRIPNRHPAGAPQVCRLGQARLHAPAGAVPAEAVELDGYPWRRQTASTLRPSSGTFSAGIGRAARRTSTRNASSSSDWVTARTARTLLAARSDLVPLDEPARLSAECSPGAVTRRPSTPDRWLAPGFAARPGSPGRRGFWKVRSPGFPDAQCGPGPRCQPMDFEPRAACRDASPAGRLR